MPPDALAVITTLALTLLMVGAFLCFLPVGTCSECDHCHRKRAAVIAQRQLDAHKAFHSGINLDPTCPHCEKK